MLNRVTPFTWIKCRLSSVDEIDVIKLYDEYIATGLIRMSTKVFNREVESLETHELMTIYDSDGKRTVWRRIGIDRHA